MTLSIGMASAQDIKAILKHESQVLKDLQIKADNVASNPILHSNKTPYIGKNINHINDVTKNWLPDLINFFGEVSKKNEFLSEDKHQIEARLLDSQKLFKKIRIPLNALEFALQNDEQKEADLLLHLAKLG